MKFLPSSLFLILFLNFNLILSDSSNPVKSGVNSPSEERTQFTSENLKKDLEEISSIKKRSKIVACMSIVRNSLSEGNYNVKEVLDNSPFDRSKSFDKIVVTMLSNCERNIKDSQMEEALTPENILTPVQSESSLAKLIQFDKNLFRSMSEITITEAEQSILNEINDSTQTYDADVSVQEEEIGLMGLKLSQLGKSTYFIIYFILLLVLVVIFGGLYVLTCKKKETKNKKKKN